ncbi:unnamed protein product [Adineta steineri]|uniref:C1q domain-containing protein n=1 Tax=Adineta steineri TaxID=433720 RepID=A0A813Z367_9BILA|nr:unnamed protein product [Adineta steineri]CAF4210210.1 unnamed protein product [Adineta steineri]
MEKQHQILSIILVLFVLSNELLITEGNDKIIDNVAYFQGSSSKSQISRSQGKVITYSSDDGSHDFTAFNNGTFGTQKAGIYLLVLGAQIGSPRRNGKGRIDIWMRQDGENVVDSNAAQSVDHGSTSVFIYTTLFQAPVNYKFEIVYSALLDVECTRIGLIATKPEKEPLVPSIILTIIQVSDGTNTIPNAQLFSSKTQLGNSDPEVVILDTVSAANRIDWATTEDHGTIKYSEAGVYFLLATAEVGSAEGTHASGDIHVWMRLNGKDMPNSNTIQSIRNGSSAILVCQTVIKLEVNDKVQLMFSTTNKELGITVLNPKNEPRVTGMLLSTFQLLNEEKPTPYAQLSSSQSQWGCTTPKIVKLDNNDGLQRIRNDNGILEFEESGTYFMMAAAQVGSDEDDGIGDVHLWMKLNGKDIANSNTIQTVNKDTAVLVCQTAMVIQAGDKLEMIFSTDVTSGTLGLVASKPHKESAVPSMIISVFKSSYLKRSYT